MKVTIRYGVNSITKEFGAPITVRDIISRQDIKAGLGFGENVTPVLNGDNVSLDTYVNEDDELLLEKQAAAKA